MQQIFRLLVFFKSALHVSGDKFAHPQEHFLTLHTAFGTMHRHAVSVHFTKRCIQGVTGGMCETLGECSLGQTIPTYPKISISIVGQLQRYWPEKTVDFFGVCVLY